MGQRLVGEGVPSLGGTARCVEASGGTLGIPFPGTPLLGVR